MEFKPEEGRKIVFALGFLTLVYLAVGQGSIPNCDTMVCKRNRSSWLGLGGTIVQSLELSPSENVSGLPWNLSVWNLHVVPVHVWVSSRIRLIFNSKLSLGMN